MRVGENPSGWVRLAAVAAVGVVLAVPAAVATRSSPSNGAAALVQASAVEMPREAPRGASSTSWYCVAPRVLDGTTPGAIDIASRAGSSAAARITWTNETGSDVADVSASVPARGQVAVATPLTQGSWAAADVEVGSGESTVWQTAGGPGGESVSACVPYTSTQWFLAGGDADGADQLFVDLYNPLATDAVVDVDLAGPSGAISDTALQGLFVPAGRLVVEDLSSRLFAAGSVAEAVICRVGRVVAYQTELRPPSPASATAKAPEVGTGAVSVTAGAPSAGERWYFPEGTTSGTAPEFLYVFNPSTATARVRVSFSLDAGQAAPIDETVSGGSLAVLSTAVEASIPVDVGETISVSVVRGPAVVAFQSVGSSPPPPSATALVTTSSGGTASPWLVTVLGAREAAEDWVLSGGWPPAGVGPIVAVSNPGRRAVAVSISYAGGGRRSATDVTSTSVPPGGHALVALPELAAGSRPPPSTGPEEGVAPSPVIVRAGAPVVAEEQWVSLERLPGWTVEMGVVGS